jgi:hypothetical protein
MFSSNTPAHVSLCSLVFQKQSVDGILLGDALVGDGRVVQGVASRVATCIKSIRATIKSSGTLKTRGTFACFPNCVSFLNNLISAVGSASL